MRFMCIAVIYNGNVNFEILSPICKPGFIIHWPISKYATKHRTPYDERRIYMLAVFFCPRSRCSRPLEIKKNVQDLPLNPGDVFLVVETLPKSHEDCWKAHQVNITTGAVKDKTGFIPSRRR